MIKNSFTFITIVNSFSIFEILTSFVEIIMFNDIIIYDDETIFNQITKTTNVYSNLWTSSTNTINISKNQWMIISTLFDVKFEIFKIYSLNFENKKLIDEKFDRFHKKRKMSWTEQSTFYDYFVFVIWRTINEKRKNQIIIDIRDFNKITMFDAYFMSLQSNIFFSL